MSHTHRFFVKGIRKWAAFALLLLLVSATQFTAPVSAATESHYRWRNDDGSETSATYAAAEDTTLSIAQQTSKRLRFGVTANAVETAPARVSGLALASGENDSYTGVIHPSAGFAYLATLTAPSKIVKITLSSLTETSVLTLATGDDNVYSSAIDTTGGFAYFATLQSPARIIKIDLSTFTQVGATLVLNSGENQARTMSIDVANGFGYVGLFTNPGRVVKFNLSTMARVGSVALGSGESVMASTLDITNGFGYFGIYTSPAKVAKIDLSTFTLSSTITMNSGENAFRSAAISGGFAYFGTEDTSLTAGKILKINLSTFTRDSALSLGSGEYYIEDLVVDSTNSLLYAIDNHSSANIAKIDIATFTRVGGVQLSGSESSGTTILLDTVNNKLYAGTATTPSNFVKVDPSTSQTYRLEYGTKVSTCSAIVTWTQVAAPAVAQHWEMVNSANVTDAAVTTDSAGVTNGGSTFVAGATKDTGSETATITTPTTAHFTELEYSIKPNANAVVSANYCFRLTNAGTATGYTYTNYAEATVTAVADTTAPTITNVTSTKTNGTYSTGEVIGIDVTFSEAVTSTGNVTVTLETGTTDRACTFTISSATTGSCNYTVQAGDTSADLDVNSIAGTIKDAALNTLTNFTPATNLAANKALVISAPASSGGGSSCPQPQAMVGTPTGGEKYISGKDVSVFFSSGGCQAVGARLMLSIDGGKTYSAEVTTMSNFSAGYYKWLIPALSTTTARLKLEVLGAGGSVLISDESDSNFSITDPNGSTIVLVKQQPSSSTGILKPRDTFTAAWTTSGTSAVKVRILLSVDAGKRFRPVATVDASAGSYEWKVPVFASKKAVLKFEALDANGVIVTSATTSIFSFRTRTLTERIVIPGLTL